MRIVIDVDKQIVIQDVANAAPAGTVTFPRVSGTSKVQVVFASNGQVTDPMVANGDGKFGIKNTGDYDGDFMVDATVWTKSGAGATTVYTFVVNWNTAGMNTALGIDDVEGNDKASFSGMAGIRWIDGDGQKGEADFKAIVTNNVIHDNEGDPVDASTGYHDGTIAIPNAVDFITIAGLNLANPPRIVIPIVRKPNAGALNLAATVRGGSLTTDGFTIDLSAATDSGAYILDYIFIV